MDRKRHYDWLKNDPEYPKEFEEAARRGAKALEDEAIRRAKEGWGKAVYRQCKVVSKVRKYDSTL